MHEYLYVEMSKASSLFSLSRSLSEPAVGEEAARG